MQKQNKTGVLLVILALVAVFGGLFFGYVTEKRAVEKEQKVAVAIPYFTKKSRSQQFLGKTSTSKQSTKSPSSKAASQPPTYTPNFNPEGQALKSFMARMNAMGGAMDQIEYQFGDVRLQLKQSYVEQYCKDQGYVDDPNSSNDAYDVCVNSTGTFIGWGREKMRNFLRTNAEDLHDKINAHVNTAVEKITYALEHDLFANKVNGFVTQVENTIKAIDDATNFEQVVTTISTRIQNHITYDDIKTTVAEIRAQIQASPAYANAQELKALIKSKLEKQPLATKISNAVDAFHEVAKIDDRRDERQQAFKDALAVALEKVQTANENDIFIEAINNIMTNAKQTIQNAVENGLSVAEKGLATGYLQYLIDEAELNRRYVGNRDDLLFYETIHVYNYITYVNEELLDKVEKDQMSGSDAIKSAVENSAPLVAVMGGFEAQKYMLQLKEDNYLVKDLEDAVTYYNFDPNGQVFNDVSNLGTTVEETKLEVANKAGELWEYTVGANITDVKKTIEELRAAMAKEQAQLHKVSAEVYATTR